MTLIKSIPFSQSRKSGFVVSLENLPITKPTKARYKHLVRLIEKFGSGVLDINLLQNPVAVAKFMDKLAKNYEADRQRKFNAYKGQSKTILNHYLEFLQSSNVRRFNISPKAMLYEDDIVEAVCKYLQNQGFTVTQKLTAKEHGDDIIAIGDGRIHELHIEAKGETSSRKGSKRYGKPFSGFQIQDHVANAFFRAAKMATNGRVGGMALPKNKPHEQCVAKIQHAIDALGIIVFWVAPDQSVTTSQPLRP